MRVSDDTPQNTRECGLGIDVLLSRRNRATRVTARERKKEDKEEEWEEERERKGRRKGEEREGGCL